MVKYKLKSNFILKKYKSDINQVKISVLENREIHALAIKLGKEKKAESIIKKVFNCPMPSPGQAEFSREYNLKILRLSTDQFFILFDLRYSSQIEIIFGKLLEAFYITEQSDAWSGLKVSGKQVIECLERVCPINLSIEAFKLNSFARTVMEHLNTIIIRNKRNEFELFTTSSSEKSFLQAIETSAKNI